MSSSTTPSSPVYLDAGLALAQIGDREAMNGILVMVEESLRRDIPAIAQWLATGDVRGASKLLHALKGFVPIFSREALCEHVGRVEALSKNGSSAKLVQAYAALQPELEQLLAEVARYLASPRQKP